MSSPGSGGSSPIITTPATPKFDTSGSFVVGTTACFFFYFNDINGNLYDPSDIDVSILDPDGDEVKSLDNIDKIETGYFSFLWAIPKTAAIGKYTITINYVAETIDGPLSSSFSEYFITTEAGPAAFTLRRVASRSYLESLIGYVQRIPVFDEIARSNKARTAYELSFPRWNQPAGVKVHLKNLLIESGYNVDYFKGRILFDVPRSQYDQVRVSYNFRWFTDSELDQFVEQGVNIFNQYPPHSVYNIDSVPDRYVITSLYASAIDAIRRLMMDLLFQEPAKVFGGLDRAKDIFSQLETLKKNYEGWLEKLLTQKKFQPYVGLTRTMTTPEFTLPGGRSRWFRYLFKGG